MKSVSVNSKAVHIIVLILFLGAFVSPQGKGVVAQEPLLILSDNLFEVLGPGNPVEFNRILIEQDSAWADFQQDVRGEIRNGGVIFHETSFGPELGTGVNPAIVLVTYGVEWDWALPANGDLVSEVDRIRGVLFQYWSEWALGQVDQGQYPVANAATYALYHYFDGNSSKLEEWASSFEAVFGVPPIQTMPMALRSASNDAVEPFLKRPFDQLDYPFRHITSFFDHHYPVYSDEGDRTDMTRFDGSSFEGIPDPDHCGYGGDTGSGNYCYSGHPGYDYSIMEGTPVKAAADGYIVACSSDYGALWIEHPNGLLTSYLHMDPLEIPNGIACEDVAVQNPYVSQGQVIGHVSHKAPKSMGDHLHFAVGYEANINERQNTDPFGWWGDGADPWEAYQGELYSGYPSNWLWLGDEVGDGYLTVDNMETQAQLFNPPSSGSDWNHLEVGYQNDSWWSSLTYYSEWPPQPTSRVSSVYWGVWGVNIERPGIYKVQAYWPTDPNSQDFSVPTPKATYELYYHDIHGQVQSVKLYADQSRNADQFTDLCAVPYGDQSAGCPQYPQILFGTGPSILILRDVSEEEIERGKYMVFFDAVRWQSGGTLAFVIDDTGSMGGEIEDVKWAVNDYVDVLTGIGINPTYHLITYKDVPEIYYIGGTSDPSVFKGWINNLSAGGGGDCPEDMLQALQLTAQKAPNSEALVMTDAGYHGSDSDKAAVETQLTAAGVTVNVISYGSCNESFAAKSGMVDDQQDTTSDNAERKLEGLAGTATLTDFTDPIAQIATATGGHYFQIASSETNAAINILLTEMIANSDLSINTDRVIPGSPKTYNIQVDGTVQDVNFLLNELSGNTNLVLNRPDGSTVTPGDPDVNFIEISNAQSYQIASPTMGVWQARISGDGEYTLSTSGNTLINFGYLSDPSLQKDIEANIKVSLTGPVNSAEFALTHLDGSSPEVISLFDDGLHEDNLSGDGIYGGTWTPTDQGKFYIHVQGMTASGDVFERIVTKVLKVYVPENTPVVNAGDDQTVYLANGVAVNATYTDPDNPENHSATIDWGDGIVEDVSVRVTGPGTGGVVGEHIYTNGGGHIVKICVTDPDGKVGCDTINVTVFESPNMVAVTTGETHTCSLSATGGIYCWGRNYHGVLGNGTHSLQGFPPAGVSGLSSGVVAIAAGESHTCALTSAGGVKCWGDNYHGQLGDGTTTERDLPVDVSGLTSGVVAITAGYSHTCALTTSGGVKCWGWNEYGQVGNGGTTDRTTPTNVSGLTSGVAMISAGDSHTCVVTTGGGAKCWGWNNGGEVGDGTTTRRTRPVNVSGLTSGVSAISAGDGHTCALTIGGGVKCWGANGAGELGDGTLDQHNTPVDVSGLTSGITAIAAGPYYTCAITTNAGLKCWGSNQRGAVGDGTYIRRLTPVDVVGLDSGVVAVSVGKLGWEHNCVVMTSGYVKCWGYNSWLELGIGKTDSYPEPVDVVGLDSGVIAIENGQNYTCALTTVGGAKCWGQGGALGDGTGSSEQNTPVDVSGLTSGVTSISANGWGGSHTCAVTTSGGVKCWGNNIRGQLGDGTITTTPRLTPVDVSGLTSSAVAVAAGVEHTCALTVSGGVKCWGRNLNGQLGDGTTTDHYTPVDVSGLTSGAIAVSAGNAHTCALTVGGGVKCWGLNSSGQLGDGTNIQSLTPINVSGLSSGVTALSAGYGHTCAVTTAGGVKCWGSNFGNIPVDVSGLSSGITALSAYGYTCGLTTEGGVNCWGGGPGNGSFTSGVTAISVGEAHICVVMSNGGVKCWGNDRYGQLGNDRANSLPKPMLTIFDPNILNP